MQEDYFHSLSFMSLEQEYVDFPDEIRQDIEDAVSHMKPWQAEDGSTYFGGWARMAQPIVDFNIVEVDLLLLKFLNVQYFL